MYENILNENLGKVVSVKTTAGIELIATLLAHSTALYRLDLDNSFDFKLPKSAFL